jgi:hypothetical protein
MNGSASSLEPGNRLNDTYRTIEELDAWRNLPDAVSVFLFFVSGGVAVSAFFLINNLILWPGINEHLATSLVIISWVLIFPIWVLTFLVLQAFLHSVGFKGLKGAAKKKLVDLNLGSDELLEVRDVLASKELRHDSLFKDAITDLIRNRSAK